MTQTPSDPADWATVKPGPAAGSPRPARDLVAATEQLLTGAARQLDAPALREALTDLHDLWLATKAAEIGITPDSGFAIVATGGLGRRELVPYSDLDLMLLHEDISPDLVSETADQLWYPLWDANIRLDHSVRTVAHALYVGGEDVTAGFAMLDARHIAGNAELSARLVDAARKQWRTQVRSRFDELVKQTLARWQRSGQIAHRAEPDLKSGRGGLRDIQLLNALAIAQLAVHHTTRTSDNPSDTLAGAHAAILDVRTELHRVSGRGRELLLAEYADEIGAALRIGDRFDLARVLSNAGRTVSYFVDAGLRTASNALPRKGFAALKRPLRRPLDEGVVEYAGEVVLARDARPERDPGLVLRVAAASATTGLPMSSATLARLSETAPELRTPWPRQALKDLVVLLSAGPATVTTIEALDRTGLWGRLFPEWGAIRDLPPRDVIHTWTVDRHLTETAAKASAFTTRVARPDLLVLSALVHDIGKGRGGDHSVIGAELATQIGTRLGLWPSDVEVLSKVVRYHLLLARTATRRDLQDPATIKSVVEVIDGDTLLLELLHTLAEADSLATGPGVWGDWKALLIGDLVRRCRMAMAGEPLPHADPVEPRYLEMAADRDVHVEMTPGESAQIHTVTMVAPDRRGLLSKASGVLALNSLRVHSASVNSQQGYAINTFSVSPQFGSPPAAELLREQLIRALNGELDVLSSIDARNREAAREGPNRVGEAIVAVPVKHSPAPPRILWFEGTVPEQVLVEVRATDRTGLLALLTGVFERAGVDIVWAKVATLGLSAIDTFCVVLPGSEGRSAATGETGSEGRSAATGGRDADVDRAGIRETLERDLLAVLPKTEPG